METRNFAQKPKNLSSELSDSPYLTSISKAVGTDMYYLAEGYAPFPFLGSEISLRSSWFKKDSPVPIGGRYPMELKGLAHRASPTGGDSMWNLFLVALKANAFDGIPFALTGYVPLIALAETTSDHLKGPYAGWNFLRIFEEMIYFDPNLKKSVELVYLDRKQMADLFHFLTKRVSSLNKQGLEDLYRKQKELGAPNDWLTKEIEAYSRSDFQSFRPVEGWKQTATPVEVIDSWKCRYGFGN
jgi:hypothetical protein